MYYYYYYYYRDYYDYYYHPTVNSSITINIARTWSSIGHDGRVGGGGGDCVDGGDDGDEVVTVAMR